ncbi:Nn.00g035310.m01.CDS01 [Neocucurbitaria sp. VM-36]
MPPATEHPCCKCSDRGHTPTPRSHTEQEQSKQTDQSLSHESIPTTSTTSSIIYIVTDTCYPTKTAFDSNVGTTTIDSAHTAKHTANARAKKIIYENERGCTVDIDKIIEELRKGLYTGIGVGGKEEKDGGCYARRCQVDEKILDEDSEDESFGSGESGELDLDNKVGDQDGDIAMG